MSSEGFKMSPRVKLLAERLTNDQWSAVIIFCIVSAMVLTVIDPLAQLITMILVSILPVILANLCAQGIDWLDDNVHAKVEMTKGYHAIYAIGISVVLGALLAPMWCRLFPVSAALYARVSPRVLFFALNFFLAILGYAIAWRDIPNRLSKEERNA